MESLIAFKSMMRQMRELDHQKKEVPFSLQFVTADRRRKRSGELITIQRAVLPGLKPLSSTQRHRERLSEITSGRNPNHKEHGTINISDLTTKRTVKVHVRLITRFNEQRVVF